MRKDSLSVRNRFLQSSLRYGRLQENVPWTFAAHPGVEEPAFAIHGSGLLVQKQMLRESKSLMKCSLTFPCNSPCRDETFWRRRNQLHGVSDRSSTGCHKHIRSALWSTIVILIRSRIVKQRAHKDVRESEHTHGCVLRAVAGTTSTVVDLIRSTSCEHCRPLCLRHPRGDRPGGQCS